MKHITLTVLFITIYLVNFSQNTGCVYGDCANGYGKYIWENGDEYTGNWKNSEQNGEGSYTFKSGSKYTGEFKNGKRHGKGTYIWADGEKHTGQWMDDKQHGEGSYYKKDGTVLTGVWKEGKYQGKIGEVTGCIFGDCDNGFGTYVWENGEKYTGYWVSERRKGQGSNYFASGERYEGEWANDMRNGYGTNYYVDGTIKAGMWENDRYIGTSSNNYGCISGNCDNGYGIYTWDTGERYEGYWKNGMRNGQGTNWFSNGAEYTGNWKDDKKNGTGTYKYHPESQYESYSGNYISDKMTGYGIFKYRNGQKYIGELYNNYFHGKGTMYYADGTVKSGTWEYDKLITSNKKSSGCISGNCTDGFGTYVTKKGDKYIGTFKNGYYSGSGTYTFASGDVYEGEFLSGTYNGQGTYIYPEGNDRIKVYDAGQTYGLYYDGGTNQFGLYGRTTNITDPTAAVVGFSDVAGNQTYGYLGFNGTWSSPSYTTSYNFGSVNGAAVYGIVDDPGRIAGFFRTTTDASYAANIAYSDVWIAGYYYIDNYDDSYAARPAFYAQSVVSCDQSNFQSAIKGYSVMDTVSSNLGWTVGGSMIAIGEGTDTGAGQDAIGIYGYSTTTASLVSYGAYCRGDDTDYAKTENSSKSGVGIFSSGSLIGSLSYGEIYGMNVSGERYGLYVDGRQYTNDIITQLSDNGTSERTATYVPTSTSVDIITKGTATLSNGKAVIYFDKKFASTVSDKEPVIITVTPVGQTEGVYIQSAKSTGFVIAENNNGKSNSVVNWIAVGTKKGYEKPINAAEILDATYDKNLKDIMSFKFEENDFIQKSMYWDGSSLKFKETSKKGISDLNKPLSLGKIKN